jgi:hypothetical protein
MPLPNEAGTIAAGAEKFGDGDRVLPEAQVIGDHAVLVAVLAGHQKGAGRAADGCVGDGVAELQAVPGKLVEVGGAGVLIAHGTEGLTAPLIGHEPDDVGPARLGFTREKGGGGGYLFGGGSHSV